MTPRLTAPQLAVLRALDALPEGEFIRARDGGFEEEAANYLAGNSTPMEPWLVLRAMTAIRFWYRLTPAGRALVAQLKTEGKL